MSYNISTWKTKKIDNLGIPLAAIRYCGDSAKKGYSVEMTLEAHDDGLHVTAHIGECGEISGYLEPATLAILVDKIALYGEGSNTDFYELLLPALRQSQGHLSAFLVWAEGDSITKLEVQDGIVNHGQYEL